MSRVVDKSTLDQVDAAGLKDFETEYDDIETTALAWLQGLGASEEQINAASLQLETQVGSMMSQLSTRNGATSDVLVAPLQQCAQFHTQYSKDQCQLSSSSVSGMPRIPMSMLQTAKTCREEQARLATSEPASHVVGDPEAEARFRDTKQRATDLMRGYDRMLRGQPIPQCGQFLDEYYHGRDKFWSRANEPLETLLADGVIDYYNACGDFEKWLDQLAAQAEAPAE